MVVAFLQVAICFHIKDSQHMCSVSLALVIFTVGNTCGFCKYKVIQKQTLVEGN